MKYLYMMLLGFGPMITHPVLAQHEGHVMSTTPDDLVQVSPDTHAGDAAAADPHAGHTMPTSASATNEEQPQDSAADPHAGHTMPSSASAANEEQHQDPAATEASEHLGNDMPDMNMEGPDAETPAPPEAASGPLHAADLYFDPADMLRSRSQLRTENGDFRTLFLMSDQFERRRRDGEDTYVWDAQGWYGGDFNKLWLKTEGEHKDDFEVQALWSRAVHPWFDLQAGIRWDFASGLQRSHLVVGLQGLLPYRFEIDAAAFISDDGDASARIEAEYDVWLSQRLILQPRMEFDISAQSVPKYATGSGLVSGELGLRLHYQVAREFAPYLGVEYERLFAGTADYAHLAGKERSGWSAVMGVRSWF